MGLVSFKINHNRLKYGEFPDEEIKKIFSNVVIHINSKSYFEDIITITINDVIDGEELNCAFMLGRYVQATADLDTLEGKTISV